MIELTEAQRQQVRKGEAILVSEAALGSVIVLAEEQYRRIRELIEEVEDRKEQAAFLRASHQSALANMKENPY